MDKRREWMGTKEAANYLGVSQKFLYRNKDLCPPSHVIGGRFRYMKEQLDEWLIRQKWSPSQQ